MFYNNEENEEETWVNLGSEQTEEHLKKIAESKTSKVVPSYKREYSTGMSWEMKVIEMRERLYKAKSSREFTRIKKEFALNEPEACKRMLKNIPMMDSLPREWQPNETNRIIDDPRVVSHAGTNNKEPEQKMPTDKDGTV